MKGQNATKPGNNIPQIEDEQERIEKNSIGHSPTFYRVAEYHRSRADIELPFQEDWKRPITADACSAFEQLLHSNPNENAVQSFLEQHSVFLLRAISGNNSRRVFPKPRLGERYVPDFLLVDEDSMGMHWCGVELESPRVKAERKDGGQRAELTHAIAQIRDWRGWIRNNQPYARAPKDQGGLGLVGIDDRMAGLILIGRRPEYSERFNDMRKDMIRNERIHIHSYDWLLDKARNDRDGASPSRLTH